RGVPPFEDDDGAALVTVMMLLEAKEPQLHIGERLLVRALVLHLEGEIDVFEPRCLHPTSRKPPAVRSGVDAAGRRRTTRGTPCFGRSVMSGSGSMTRSLAASKVTRCAIVARTS